MEAQQHPITSYRKENDLSMRRLAELVGTSEATICRLEGGKQAMTIPMAKKLEKATGIWAGEWIFPDDIKKGGGGKNGKISGYRSLPGKKQGGGEGPVRPA
jgi:transcriptional regulator with XRE-family HTH domain